MALRSAFLTTFLDDKAASAHNGPIMTVTGTFAADPEVRMIVKGLMLDPSSNSPIVILREQDSDLFLPIWIGAFEASAIQLRIEGIEPPRPMTHDLLTSVLTTLGAVVTRVVISDLKENTFFATLHVQRGGETWEVDSRPSDALAVALRVEAPVFVRKSVLDQAHAVDLTARASDDEKLKKWLDDLTPEDLGKYTM